MAYDLVSSCLYIPDSNKALNRAKRLIKETFEQPCQFASAFVSKLTKSVSKGVNNPKELQAFAVNLEMCLTTLTGIRCVHEINNNQKVLRQIIDRFPVSLQHKWRALMDNIMHEMKRAVSIKNAV